MIGGPVTAGSSVRTAELLDAIPESSARAANLDGEPPPKRNEHPGRGEGQEPGEREGQGPGDGRGIS